MIGRIEEQFRLQKALLSDEAEFIAVYGRRRVGKTFLIRQTFADNFAFQHTGLANATFRQQLQAFRISLQAYGLVKCPALDNWLMAFEQLKSLLQLPGYESKKIIFIDEMPWMDTPRSGFLAAFEHFWNGWAAWQKNIVLIICGSATSWIINNVLRSVGGLHNRVTQEMLLRPFTLQECEDYAKMKGLAYTRRQIVECYMILGGVPYYWKFLERGLSPAQNIDRLFFQPQAYLSREFQTLYASLFKKPEPHISIVMALTRCKSGMNKKELANEIAMSNNGFFSNCLEELEQCGFIRQFKMFGKNANGAVYQLVDNYTRFYADVISHNKAGNPEYWSSIQNTPAFNAWQGLAFEMICLQHIDKLRSALQIGGVVMNACSWRSSKSKPGARIDLLLDRNDGIINLCEMKFTRDYYLLSEAEIDELCRKREIFRAETHTKKALHLTIVATAIRSGDNISSDIQKLICLDDLF